ncbi:histidine kinase, partial [Cryomyces antarcticus]
MFKYIDWTQKSLPGLSKYLQFVRNHDWASTALGPMASWSSQLRQMVFIIMSDPDPRLILWGSDLTLIYNEACVPLIGEKYPKSLGGSPTDTFAEIWDHIVRIVNLAMHKGKATRVPSMVLTMDRHGFPEETVWSFCMVPILGPDGTAIGALDEFTEVTHLSIAERRMSTILRVGENAAAANNLKELWTQVIAALEPNVNDVPFALLYSVYEDRSNESESSMYSGYSTTSKQCLLEGLIGFTKDHPAATTAIDLSNDTEDFVIPFQSAWRSGGPVLMQAKTGNLPQVLAASIPGRGFGDTCKEATVLPIHNLSDNTIIAFLLLGLNPRRPHDEDYRQFILFLHDRLIKSAASVFLPEEQRRSQAIAEEIAIRHASLSKQLLQRTQEAERSEAKFTRLAKYAPVGMYLFDTSGSPLYLNDAYFELLGIPKEDGYSSFEQNFWRNEVYSDDLPLVEGQWQYLLDERSPSTIQYRLKRPWKSFDNTNGAEMSGPTWILSTAFPEIDEDGSVVAIMGWLTDISSQKWSERLQAQRLEDALETKRQSENFIDMTSHEMRNPLSAIIQSADGIIAALTTPGDVRELIADAVQTIILCAQHQKRIVDDVLTLSKLDSNLLVITPDQVKPIELVQKALKMYEAELDSTKVQARLSIDESYTELSIDTVPVDSSRLLQVLLNLLTNAIKFTQYQKQRVITIFLSASYTRPSSGPGDVSYIPRRSNRPERSLTPEWGVGEDLYLQFAVQDTGSGITEEEMKVLFLRFSQASPKTYGKYGGSGLGLFISRELTELQGGQIGVHSIAGQGSTFTFYIKARRWLPEKVITTEESDARASDPLYVAPLSPRPPHSIQTSPSNLIASTPPLPPLPATVVPQKLARDSLHVLIVEDNLVNQRVMAQQLRRLGCTVHVADHGLEALSFLSTTTFSVIIPATKPTADNVPGT